MMPPPNHRRPPEPPGPQPQKRSLLQNLGAFFGHIAHGVKTPAPGPMPPTHAAPLENQALRQVVRQQTREQEVLTPDGKVVLRRTVIDEIERVPGEPGPGTEPTRPVIHP